MEAPIGAVSALEKRERAEMSGGGSIPPVSANLTPYSGQGGQQ